MPRPLQPVLLPWLQPGGLAPPFQPPPCPLPCLAKAGAVMPTPMTSAAVSAAPAIYLAMTPLLAIAAVGRETPWVAWAFRLARCSGRADQAGAAVDDERLAGDVAGLLRQQKADGVADIPAEPLDAEHRGLAPRLAPGRGHLPGIHARRIDRAGRDAVDADALRPVIDRHRPGQRDDRPLRGRIGGQPARPQRRDRRHVDDGAAAGGLDHRRDRMARHQEHAVDIDLHDTTPVLDRGVDDAAAPA